MSIIIEKGKVSRTKKCIIDALLKLMEEDSFEDITIMQITQEAEVARRTFYLNYSTKIEVLADYIKSLYDTFAEEVSKHEKRDYKSDVLAFFKYWEQHRDFLLLLEKNNQFSLLLDEFENILSTSEIFDFSFIERGKLERDKKEYVVVTIAAALWRILKKWIEDGMVESAEEIAKLFLVLAK